MLVYIAGPYQEYISPHDGKHTVDANIEQARGLAVEMWRAGHAVICPHTNTANFDVYYDVSDDVYLRGDLEILARCDAVLMTLDWTYSRGATQEREYALERGIPVYEWPNFPKMHPTEIARPVQVRAFIDTVMELYRLHLDKNSDYSPANILGTGMLGVVVRLWDKTARLMNLTGFRIEIASSRFEAPLTPRNESYWDSLRDLANYGIIACLLWLEKWGK